MKKIIVCLLGLFLINSGCTHETKQAPACTEFDANCEILKEWCLVKVVAIVDTNSIDALGRKLEIGQWYLRNNRVKALMPFADEPQDYGNVTHNNLRIFESEYPNTFRNDCRVLRGAKIDTLLEFRDNYVPNDRTYLIVAGVLCTKGGEVRIASDIHTTGYKAGWIDYK